MVEPSTTLGRSDAGPVDNSSDAADSANAPALHLIHESTCRDAPVRAAWLADYLAERTGDRLVVVASDRAPGARRLGLHADHLLRRRWGLPLPAARASTRWLREAAACSPVYDWSLGRTLGRLLPRCADSSVHPPKGLPLKLDRRRLGAVSREALRAAWAIEPGVRVAWLAADSVGAIDVMPAVAATGLAAEAGRPWALVIHPRMPGVARARRLVEAMGRGERLIVDERAHEPWAVVAGCDAALLVGADAALAARWAGLGGLDIIATPAAQSAMPGPSPDAPPGGGGRSMLSNDDRAQSVARLLCRISERSPAARTSDGSA